MSVSIAGSDSLSVGSSEDPILHARGGHKFSPLLGPSLSPPTLVPHSNPPWESPRNKGSADDPWAKASPVRPPSPSPSCTPSLFSRRCYFFSMVSLKTSLLLPSSPNESFTCYRPNSNITSVDVPCISDQYESACCRQGYACPSKLATQSAFEHRLRRIAKTA
jgi:hypothetical protein